MHFLQIFLRFLSSQRSLLLMFQVQLYLISGNLNQRRMISKSTTSEKKASIPKPMHSLVWKKSSNKLNSQSLRSNNKKRKLSLLLKKLQNKSIRKDAIIARKKLDYWASNANVGSSTAIPTDFQKNMDAHSITRRLPTIDSRKPL